LSLFRGRKRRHDVQAFAARRLAKRHKAKVEKAIAHFPCSVDHYFEIDVRRRIEIKNEAAGKGGIAGLIVPRMQLDAGTLRYSRQTLDSVNLYIGFAVARNGYLFKQV
jgi:hypothetical protein